MDKYYANEDYVWLVKKWSERNVGKNPSRRQIMDGILVELTSRFSQKKSTDEKYSEVIKQQVNAFKALFQYTKLTGEVGTTIDEDIQLEDLHDPQNPTTKAILFIYSLDTFLPGAISKAQREKDETKIETLGPFSIALRSITLGAESNKPNYYQMATKDVIAWRGTILRARDVKDYMQMLSYRK